MEFKHPKYYAALRAQLRKLQAAEDIRAASLKPQASSLKQQAKPEPSSGSEDSSRKLQASSDTNQTQVSSHKLQAQ